MLCISLCKIFPSDRNRTIFECNLKIMTKNIKCDISIFTRGQLNYYLVFVMMTSRNSFKSVCNSLTFEKKDNIYSWYVIALFFPNKTRDGVAGSNISVYSFFSLVLDRSRTHTWCVFEIKELMNIDFSRKI